MTEHAIPRDIDQIQKDRDGHSIFSPSSSPMWANCAGSLIPNIYAKDTAGVDAAYGTVAHAVTERWLKSGVRPTHLVGTSEVVTNGGIEYPIEIDDSMMEFVEQCVSRVIYLPGDHHVETRVDFSDLTPIKKQSGTADHALCRLHHLDLDDWKFGKSRPIYAKDNTQLLLYAYGFFVMWDWLYDFQTITMRIHMPRLDHFDEWTITRAELLEWAALLKKRAYLAWCQDAERTPGIKQCEYCRIKSGCAAHVVLTERLVDGVFDDLTKPVTAEHMAGVTRRLDSGLFELAPTPLSQLTTVQKALLLPYRKMIETWLAELHADLEQRCLNGEEVPGYKIVAGKSNRVFVNDGEAAELLDFLGLDDETVHPRGMISPSQAEIALAKAGYKRKELPELLNAVVRKPLGKSTLVPESDKRAAIVSVNRFENLDDEL